MGLISTLVLVWLPIPCFGSVHGGSQPLIRLHSHPRFQVWCPAGVLGVGPRPLIGVLAHWCALGLYTQATGPLIKVRTNWASGVCWGCLSGVHSPGAEGVWAQEAMAATENSLNSC